MLSDRLVPPYSALTVVESTGSTNADLSAAAAEGAGDRTVLIARAQTAGRGRRDRSWVSPGGGLYCSVLLRPDEVPRERLGTLTVVAGIALVRACADLGVTAHLKWPNDLLHGEAKLCGVLAEASGDAVVLGMGLNIAALPPEIPSGAGGLRHTSLEDAGAESTDHEEVTVRLLTELDTVERAWREAGGDLAACGLLEEYRRCCHTIGKRVRVERATDTIEATAVDVDATGQLVLDDGRAVSAGDVVHLRWR
ncbi:biotin--[acetyl-CoA-carboxylase] ligase [Sciscionella sediminilitoris]|uniref:biotin--[acetyl-CoA-carboxylase] ligase n=1 Tax=Sciscionella sediminilitoris TaxID=1445613 RepID=UPI0004DFC7D1|nr:biotin--[acetyl-CoA-carboxylase] ligase [Sciscionella sp. SE31]